MPDGGLDSKKRRDAARSRPVLVVEDLVRVVFSPPSSPVIEDSRGFEGADGSSLFGVAIVCVLEEQ